MVITAHKSEEKLGLRILEAAKKLKENGVLFDCSVKAGGREFPAHSLLLAANSESMKNEIIGGEKELVFEGVKPETVERCVGLIYGEQGEDLESNMGDILEVSSKIKLDGVKDFCFDFIEENLTVQNCFTAVERAKSYDRAEVLQSAEKFISENLERVIGAQEFLLLSKEDLLHYIEISNADHQVIWKAVTRWIDGTKQDELLPELMNTIGIKAFPIEFLIETVWKEPRVQDLAKEIVIHSLFFDLENLKEGITIENCFSIRSFNQAYNTINKQPMKMTVTRFMAENLAQIKDKEEFMLMDLQDLTEILQALELPSAIEKWDAAVGWMKHDSNREIYFSQLVDALNIETFTFNFLLGVIWEEHLVRESKQLKKKITGILFSTKFEDNINVDNCFFLNNINLKYNSVNRKTVTEILRRFMAENFERIMEKQEYLKLEKDDVASFIINAKTNEMTKWQGLIQWMHFQKSREDYLQEMISAFELDKFSFNFLLEQVYNEPLVRKSESVRLQVIDCLLSDPQKLKQNITKENCLASKRMLDETSTARRHSEAEKIVNRHVMFNLESVILKSEFPSLSYDSLVSILQSPESVVQSDAAKWKAILRWVKHEKTREVYLLKLLEILDIGDPSFLLKAVWKEPLVQDCEAAKVFVITCLFCDVTTLHEILTVDNCFFIVDINKEHNSSNRKEVLEALIEFMARNFHEISERRGLMALTKDDVVSILEITTTTEMGKWQAMMKWIKSDESRENYLEEMMRAAKVNEFTFDFLLQTVYNEPLVQKSDFTTSLVIIALFSDLQRLERSINESNCLTLKHLMEPSLTKHTDADKIVNRYVMLNLGALSKLPGFCGLDLKGIASLFDASESTTQSEEIKWEAVLRWVKHEKTRAVHLPKLIDILKIQDFSFLLLTIWQDSLVQESEEMKIEVAKWLFTDLRKLEANINIDNCFQLQDLNEAYNHVNRDDGGEMLTQFLMQHFGEIVGIVEFLKLRERNLIRLIESPDTNAFAKKKFKAIIKWVKHDEARETVFPRLFELLDLKAMDIEYVRDVVMKEPLVMNSQECLLHLNRPDGDQHPSFAIFDDDASELTVLSLEDESSHSVSVDFGNLEFPQDTVTVGGEVYLVTNKRILKLQSDGRTISSKDLTSILIDRKVVEFQDKIYVIQPVEYPMFCFDPADNSLIDNLPGCGLGLGFFVSSTEDSIYAMGGDGTANKAKRFDPRTRTWSGIASMSKRRLNAAAATLDGKIYVMGGCDEDFKPTASVECYCPESNSWTEMSNMNASRHDFSACVFNDQLYAVGGDERRKENGFYESSIKVYNRQLDRWVMIHKYESSDCGSFACIWLHGPHESFKPDLTLERLSKDIQRACNNFSRSHTPYTTQPIGPEGGSIELLRYKIDFPPGDVKEEKEFEVSVREAEDEEDSLSITPEVRCYTPIKLDKPVSIAMKTCMSADANTEIPVTVRTREKSWHKWQETDQLSLGEENEIKFNSSQVFGQMKITTRVLRGKIHLLNNIGIQKDTGRICSIFTKFEVSNNLSRWILKRKNFKILLASPLEVCAPVDSEVRLEIENADPTWAEITDIFPHSSFKVNKEFMRKGFHVVCFEFAPNLPGDGVKMGISYKLKIGEREEVFPLTTEWPLDSKGKVSSRSVETQPTGSLPTSTASVVEELMNTSVAEIGPSGGTILLDDSTIILSPRALFHQTELRASTVDPEDDSPDELLPISPTLQLAPNMDLEVPAEVNLQTWATSQDSEAYVYFRETATSPWEDPRPVTMPEHGIAKFEIAKFCEYRIFIHAKSILKWSFRLQSCLFGNTVTKKLTNRVTTDCRTSTCTLQQEMSLRQFISPCSANPTLSAKVGDEIEVRVHDLKIQQGQEQNLPPRRIKITKELLKRKKHDVQDFTLSHDCKGFVDFTHTVQLYRQGQPHGDPITHEEDRINLGLPKPTPTAIGKSNTGEYSGTTHGESVQVHQEIHYH